MISYLRHIWVMFTEIMVFFFLWGGVQKTFKKRTKQTEEKYWKVKRKNNEEYKGSQITTIYIFGFTFYMKNYIFLEHIV